MISFNSTLSNKLKLKNTNSFWVAKLYYNDESAFIGISDTHRVDGSDIYYGLVTDWGNVNQSIDYFEFKTSVSNLSVKLANTINSFQGGRFSDALSAKNFANRKFELFQCVDGLTFDTSANQIATGIISGDFTYNRNEVSISLIDDSFGQHKQIPKTLVTTSSYANAPTKNINKPIPIAYGDFHARTDVGTIDSYFDSHYHKGQFPAIITNKWDDSNNVVVATPDSVALHTLDADYVFNYHDEFGAFNASNVAVANGTPYIRVSGSSFYFYPTLLNGGALADNNFGSGVSLSVTNGSATAQFDVPKLKKLGSISNIYLLVTYYNSGSGTFAGATPDDYKFRNAGTTGLNVDLAWSATDNHQRIDVSSVFTAGEKTDWSMEGTYEFYLNNASGTSTAVIGQANLEFYYEAEQDYTQHLNSINSTSSGFFYISALAPSRRTAVAREVNEIKTEVIEPSAVDYVFYSGKGRKFGSWADDNSRNNGYDEADLIENPIYIVEDILRTELSASNVDTTSFDVSGNATNGLIADVFDDEVTDVKFAFSQFKLIESKELVEEIGRLCGTYVFLSGDGNFKTATLRKPADYDSDDVVQTINYNLITLDAINKTPTSGVRNDIDVNYGYHYGDNQTTSTVNVADSTSKGTTVNGINQTLKMKLEAGKILDSTTATALATYYKDIGKDQKIEIMFDVPTPIYNGLEVGDLINFSNWDANVKLYGSAMDQANNIFIITQTNKRPNGCEFFCTEVSD